MEPASGVSYSGSPSPPKSRRSPMNRTDRLLALILYLQGRRIVTAEEMAQHFKLSVRTIYRDLAALGEAGVPIEAEAGVGYRLVKGYHLPPVNFTEEEAAALLTGGLLVRHLTDASLDARMASALTKVRAILPATQLSRIDRLERGLGTATQVTPPSQAPLDLLQQALASCRLLRFHYRGATQTVATERQVEAHALVHYLGRWHLLAWCRLRGAWRDFRSDRMEGITLLDETFAPRPGPVGPLSAADFIDLILPPTRQWAQLRFTPLAADRARREWWQGVRDIETVPGKEDGGDGDKHGGNVTLALACFDLHALASWLLGFGTEVRVLEPPALRDCLIELAQAAAAHHAAPPVPRGAEPAGLLT